MGDWMDEYLHLVVSDSTSMLALKIAFRLEDLRLVGLRGLYLEPEASEASKAGKAGDGRCFKHQQP
jgi:hypothetical protein